MKVKKKNFDSVKWVREIRDKFYKEHRNLNRTEYLKAIRKSISSDVLSPEKGKRTRRKLKENV